MGKFSATVKDWTEKAKRNSHLVHQSAVQKLYEGVNDDTPRVTGNARRSWLKSQTAMPQISDDSKQVFADVEVAFTLKEGVPTYIGAQAAYMPRLNYGFTGTDKLGRKYNQKALLFVEKNAEQWPEYVDQAAKEIGE